MKREIFKVVARSALPILCGLQLIYNLLIAPETNPRAAQDLLEQLAKETGSASAEKIRTSLRLNASASSSILVYNVILSALGLGCSIVLMREDTRGQAEASKRDSV